jgi:hypothetical protein
MPNVYGTVAYASSKFLTQAATIASPATDLESAVYILLFLKNGHLPWHKAQTTTAVETSRKQIVDPDVLALLYVLLYSLLFFPFLIFFFYQSFSAIIHQERNAAHDSMIRFLQHAQYPFFTAILNENDNNKRSLVLERSGQVSDCILLTTLL